MDFQLAIHRAQSFKQLYAVIFQERERLRLVLLEQANIRFGNVELNENEH